MMHRPVMADPILTDEPLRTATFLLTRADALAFEQAASRFTPLGVLLLVLWLGLCGSAAWLIPRDWAGPLLGWSFSVLVSLLVAIGYVLVLVGLAIRQYWRAGRRVRRPEEITLSQRASGFEISGNGLPRSLPYADIRESILTRTHLFLIDDDGVLILPARAFPEDGVIEELAARIAGRPLPAKVDDSAPQA